MLLCIVAGSLGARNYYLVFRRMGGAQLGLFVFGAVLGV